MSSRLDTSHLSPRRLTVDDAPAGYALSSAAGWNQTLEDWAVMLEIGHGLALVDVGDHPIATSILLPYRPNVDWIGMMLVESAWRGKGVGTRLMRLIVEISPNPILGLDATEQGIPLYKKLGFAAAEDITRFERPAKDLQLLQDSDDEVILVGVDRFSELISTLNPEMDLLRRNLLSGLEATKCSYMTVYRDDRCVGLGVVRRGRVASQIGPLFATDAASAGRVLRWIASQRPEILIADVPTQRSALTHLLHRAGFKPSRSFVRMYAGGLPVPDRREYLIAGPEFG